ncbi:hypothetical protein MYCO108962_19155 [Mycobacterium colombiense]|uniref:Uncharacterized protein n=1 Tax=Mycobacterium colombiense CECT 3035 TaxID=1041522 RepID=J4JUA6_9MYCO|nr:hypothetical protein [Mycobacterium colombiense]EJO86952.1 hypothetical protein MCOL_V218691 [Mycobacterium colombiense CECT 3035]
MSELTVIHLARGSNGRVPLERFLESYRAHNAGVAHQFLVVFKGYADQNTLTEHEALARTFGAETLRLARDDLFDIGAYHEATREIDTRYVAFFNSFSEILADEWLARLYHGIRQEGVGLVGVTGSWESQTSNAFQLMRAQPLPHLAILWLYKWRFSPHFPNPHIRTNGFIMQRDTFLALKSPQTRSKQLAWAFESGRSSMTRQIERQGLKVLVAGRDGRYFAASDWPQSATYCANGQSNLIVQDNHTRKYGDGSTATRDEFQYRAWGKGATADGA